MRIYLILCFILLGCVSTPTQKLNPAVYYRNDICFEYKTGKKIKVTNAFGEESISDEVKKFCGTGVLPYKDSYELKVIGYDKLNFFSLTTCHEETTSENPDKGIFKKNGQVNIKYSPTLDKGYACPMYVSAYSMRERHAFGVIAFENPRFQLPVSIWCNGGYERANGISLCQSRADLMQSLQFDEEVKVVRPEIGSAERKEQCPEITPWDDGKTFVFKIPERECIYQFIGKKSGKFHRLLTIGYEEIIIRDN